MNSLTLAELGQPALDGAVAIAILLAVGIGITLVAILERPRRRQ